MTQQDEYPVSDWQYEVANGDTRLGYEEWLKRRKDAEGEETLLPRYRVRWEIDIWARSPEQAALTTLEIMRDPNSIGTCFDVTLVSTKGRKSSHPKLHHIDLMEHAVCDDCGHVFKLDEENDFAAIPNLNERIEPGGLVPVCECPECGSLAYLAHMVRRPA